MSLWRDSEVEVQQDTYEQDGLGSVTSLSNSTSALVDSYTYDSFGNLTASTNAFTNPFRYIARNYDSETALHYYRAYRRLSRKCCNEEQHQYSQRRQEPAESVAKKRDIEKNEFVVWYRVRNALPQRRKKNGFDQGGQDKQYSTNQHSRQNSSSPDTHKALQSRRLPFSADETETKPMI